MSILPQLERDLLAAAERRLSGAPAARGWRRRRRVALALAIAAVALMGAGGGALLLAPGKPVAPAFELSPMSTVGLGRPLAPSLALLSLRVADPAGGPAWGMRVIRTTRGLACIQAGRVIDGRLGAVGIGYAFKGDGRFHPFAPADAISEDSCATLAGNGLAFQPGAPTIVTADGLALAGENLWPYERVHCDLPGQEDWGVRCPRADLREVAVGMLGPDAASIRVHAPGKDFTVKPDGPDGAYLIVLPAPAGIDSGSRSSLYAYVHHTWHAPVLAALSVTYEDGSTCQIPAATHEQVCSPKGLDIASAMPTAAKLRTTLHVSYRPLLAYSSPLSVTGPGAGTYPQSIHPSNKPGPGLVVSFRAPVAAPNISSGYDLELQPLAPAGCSTPALILSQPTQQTIAAGQRVQISVSLGSNCRTTYVGRVFFVRSSGSYSAARTSDEAGEGPLYEVISGLFSGARHSPEPGVTVGRLRIAVPGR
jgi:hypothetical protein